MSDLVNLVRLGFKQSSLSGVVVPPKVAKFDGMRSSTIEVMMNELKEVRENQFVKLLSTIDYAWEQYGNGITD